MRLNRLDLTRYGRFSDAQLQFPAPTAGAPDLHIIFGRNEAGKSTLFSAWLDLLYGIPVRTRYDFLHPGPTLQIGAELTHANGTLDVVRVKRNGPSLQDNMGNTLPEATMQAALAGLGRDGYGAMFSLDDDTLEQGGESILSSRGDLGEMLFSASAGLAGLGPQLDTIRKELDGFHKPRARNTTLKAAKEALQNLDRQRRDLDVSASAAQKLQREVGAAQKAWEAARQTEKTATAALKQIETTLAMLPQQARLAKMRTELAPLATLPDVTDADARSLQDIEQTLRERGAQITLRAETIAEHERRINALCCDPAILALTDQIAEAAGLHPLHHAALADLPRRRDTLAKRDADLARQMAELGLSGDAAEHAIASPILARLRALVARRDVVTLAHQKAQEETRVAENRLRNSRETLGDPAPEQDLRSLSHLVSRLRSTDPEAVLSRAEHDCAARDSDLDRAIQALAPWRGTAADLVAQDVPAPWQITAWATAEHTIRQDLSDAAHAKERSQAYLAAAHQTMPADIPGAPTLSDATDARRQREAAWATHLARMTPATAAEFETALRLDDRITVHIGEATAAQRQRIEGQAALTRLTADVAAKEADWQAKQAAQQAHEQAVDDCAAALGLPGASLGDMQRWLDLRDRALEAVQNRDHARALRSQAQADLTEAAAQLARALRLPESTGFAGLLAEALGRLDLMDRQKQAALRLAEMHDDLKARQSDLDAAARDLATWQQDWRAACSGTALAQLDEDDPALAAFLDDLDHLGRAAGERAELQGRIAKMEANSHAFHTCAGGILAALSLPADQPWSGVIDRQTAAQKAEQDHARITADLAREQQAQAGDQAQIDALNQQARTLGERLNWAGDGTLADHMAECLRATRLRRSIAELEAELAQHPAPDRDAQTLESEAAELHDQVSLARSESEACFAALTEAKRALAAVGGDDAVARIAAERANLLNELKDQTRAHLAQRFALMAFEQGLRQYRDSHRSAMLARASGAFSKLTLGAYSGLAAQPKGDSEVLVAIPDQGGAKLATDLSKGTRFQLYLALRIAGYHELAKSRPPVPFIADDIMETFDDSRAEQAFALLGDMSRTGQVIYLTHHQHLCDIARAAFPEARVIDLHQFN
ncbi:ATP-binding protein [Oceaniglobus ichthyenteri]|uniref:ATP-binding protein n=1 Tax=Oceaniglobus ichthyenteri TaxID=2136177 RepID=UPI0013DDB3BB|nr:AAA family ATPase [Oceaniglobus ichthyenteri]